MSTLARLVLPTALLVLAAARADASTWYVRSDAPPGGNGTSWATAFDTLQAGIAAAAPMDHVWVKTGTYRPGTNASPRTSTFAMKNGVRIFGGFTGSETALGERDWIANPTVLSGDLQGDDGPDFANRDDNVYHVVDALGVNPGAVLDGFVVRGGNANGSSTGGFSWGGGVFGADGTLRNLVITDNEAFAGGGLYVDWTLFPNPIVGCTFRGNRTTAAGGGILSYGSFVLRQCVFTGNVASEGAAIRAYLDPQGTGSIESCLIAGNSSAGAAAVSTEWCTLSVRNSTIAHNQAGIAYAGLVALPSGAATVSNSILWGNTCPNGTTYQQQFLPNSTIVHSAVQGGSGPLDVDPRFEDPDGADDVFGTADDDYRLRCTSPFVDRGDNSYAAGLLLDLAGNPRFADDPATVDQGVGTAPIVDLGPYEFVCDCDGIESYCTALPNTSGLPASIGATGSTSLFANALVLHAENGPPLKNGLFFYGPLETSVPWGDGLLCVAGSLFRLPVVTLDASGAVAFPFDVTQHPASGGPGAILEGSTWNFQLYFRDPFGGPAGWNSTDAISITFCR